MMRYAVLGATGATVQGLMEAPIEGGLLVFASSNVEDPSPTLRDLHVALVFVGQASGEERALAAVRTLSEEFAVVLLEERSDPALGRRATEAGARASLVVPLSGDDVVGLLHDVAVERYETAEYRPLEVEAEPIERVAHVAD